MTQTQVKEELNTLIDALSPDQAALLLDFAALLRQRQVYVENPIKPKEIPQETEQATAWETALLTAEIYWFQLPEHVRAQYAGRTVALLRDHILDADSTLKALRKRVAEQYPDQPILYLEADAKQEPMLIVRSPRLR